MEETYIFSQVKSSNDLEQILSLQRANLRMSLDEDVIQKEGFVTCEHDICLLKKMNHPDPHIISLYRENVVGYCLVMAPRWREELDVLKSMFEKIECQNWNDHLIAATDYITMGQVCIHKDHRGKGLFRKMYQHYKKQLAPQYRYCITEVATSNHRSRNAHSAVGFEPLVSYNAEDGNSWELIIWDWNS